MIHESIALLGTPMKDRVTGFAGVVSSVSFDAYGCIQMVLTPPVAKDGKPQDGHWFDAKRLAPNGKRVMSAPTFGATTTSIPGPNKMPAPARMPSR